MTPTVLARLVQLAILGALCALLPELVLVVYLGFGFGLAYALLPMSWPFGINAVAVTLLWPWLAATVVVHRVTGRWPRWGMAI